MPITNIDAATATPVTLPATIVLDTSQIAPAAEAWYKFATGALRIALSMVASNTTSEYPYAELLEADGVTFVTPHVFVDRHDPVNVPVAASTDYYLRISPDGGLAVLTLAVAESPLDAVAIGDLVVQPDADDQRPVICRATDGVVVRAVPNAVWGRGLPVDALASGKCLMSNSSGVLRLMDLNDFSYTDIPDPHPSAGNYGVVVANGKFYATKWGAGGTTVFGRIYEVTDVGVVTLKAYVSGNIMQANAVSPDGNTLYYNGTATPAPISRWNLATDSALADFVPLIAGSYPASMVCLADGSVVACWRGTSHFVRRYSAAGALLATYSALSGESQITVSRGADDPASFWIVSATGNRYNFRRVKVSDGTDLANFNTDYIGSGGYNQTAPPTSGAFWPPDSFIAFAMPIALAAPVVAFATRRTLHALGTRSGSRQAREQ